MKTNFGSALIALLVLALAKAGEIQPERGVARISSEAGRSFNPFSWGSWLGLPSQFMQYWFPLFQPAYRPPNLPRPTAPAPPPESHSEKTDNIFGVSDPPGDSVEYLPPADEIEW